MAKHIDYKPGKAPGELVILENSRSAPEQVHLLRGEEVDALNAAIAARRPLLVRGEPGTGKTQLARAAAMKLGRAFVSHVVDARTEPHDLLWYFDAVERLAEAQVIAAGAKGEVGGEDEPIDVRSILAEERYVKPQALWWAFDWDSAKAQARVARSEVPHQADQGDPANGTVVLIDEIDKAEQDVPNALLEALGNGCFKPRGHKLVRCSEKVDPPLVILTTNEERVLPDAFVRRCLVLKLALPKKREALLNHLVEVGKAHFKGKSEDLIREAAKIIADDRENDEAGSHPASGQAEFLDLLRAVFNRASDAETPEETMDRIKKFVIGKHLEEQP